jgi:uncharacterized membrane protein (UPF0127 family)
VTGNSFRLLLACLLATTPRLAQGAGELPTATLSINGHKIVAELATTPDQQATGLMHRFSLKPDHGMLFVFQRSEQRRFWMKNTFIPLSIAFIAADGSIVNIEDMQPHDEGRHCARRPVRFALEMTQGWFARKGIAPGARIGRLPAAGQ